jgi:hypothetical protein
MTEVYPIWMTTMKLQVPSSTILQNISSSEHNYGWNLIENTFANNEVPLPSIPAFRTSAATVPTLLDPDNRKTTPRRRRRTQRSEEKSTPQTKEEEQEIRSRRRRKCPWDTSRSSQGNGETKSVFQENRLLRHG